VVHENWCQYEPIQSNVVMKTVSYVKEFIEERDYGGSENEKTEAW